MAIKTKINKWYLITLKSFCTPKEAKGEKTTLGMGEINNKWNDWQRINLQNIWAAQAAQYQKNEQWIKEWAEDLKRRASKEDTQMANRHRKRFSTSLITREMKIKTTLRGHFTPIRMATFRKSTNNKCRRGCREKGTLLHCWWECKVIQPLWEKMWRFLKKLGIRRPHDPTIPLPGIYSEKNLTKTHVSQCSLQPCYE